jgi:ABC-type transport system substrate-binding protein
MDLWDYGYAGVDPTDVIREMYYSGSARPDQGSNYGRFKDKEFDALLDQTFTLDEQRRQEVFCQMAKILDEKLPEALLFTTINADAYSARLDGVQATVNDVVTWNVADWQVK